MIIKNTQQKGRGVFATKQYRVGSIIEECPVVVLPSHGRTAIDKTSLYDYYFSWGANQEKAAIALGYGSLYNHSYKPNAVYKKITDENVILFIAYRGVKPGDEITVNYNEDPTGNQALWFDVRE